MYTSMCNSHSHRKVTKVHSAEVVISYMTQLRRSSKKISSLFKNLEYYGELILIGGAVRDLCSNVLPRDFDFVINSSETDFEELFEGFQFKKNRFGGYKVLIDDFEFDIWSIKNHWAFRENILEPIEENIVKGSFFNIDALQVNISRGTIDASIYNEVADNGILDIILDDYAERLNPNPEVNIVRAIVLKNKWGLVLSDRLTFYIDRWLDQTHNPKLKLLQAEMKHYGENFITEIDYQSIINLPHTKRW
ncbi:hypothetical protein [Paenibacillus sp. Root444D2]|uniref:hypothetical protein n=1 Tax=Paenibacillus sp. Root444D2 TaxID=1736538 RepID=UPI00070C13EE|nr:hypothetical protein [Paenibacillus sp. Root444D2]KQX68474.1 hypothetical protein ASD40_23590 [Paenibacillus sp. Root444D2]